MKKQTKKRYPCLLCKGKGNTEGFTPPTPDSQAGWYWASNCLSCKMTGKITKTVFLSQLKSNPEHLDNLEIVELYEKVQ